MQSSILSSGLLDLKGDLSQIDLVCVYGIGDASVYRQLRSWLQKEEQRFILFIEDDEEHFLKMKDASWTKDPKIRLFFYQEGYEEIFKEIAWEFLFLKFGFFAVAEYAERKGEKMVEIFSKVEHYHRGIDLVASDFQDMGVAVLKNVMENQKRLASSLLGQSLQGACCQIPAVICGAGPSLDLQIPLLAALKDRAMIFAGGSAVAALTKQGASPHFCAHFDPDPPRDRFLQQDAAEIPHFYQSRFSSSLLSLVHAPLLWMSEGGNYPIEKWLKERYLIPFSAFDSGWTAANFCTAVAVLLGCNPIIFVGMEFSFQLDQVYGAGMKADEHKGVFVEVQHIDGKRLLTKNDWVMSAEWQAALGSQYPQTRFLNATPQGLNILHAEKISLNEAAGVYLQRQFDLSGAVHALLQRAQRLKVEEAAGQQITEMLIESYKRCDKVGDFLLKLWEKHYPKSPMEKGEYATAQYDLEKEVAFQMILDPLWQIWKRPILRASSHPLGNHVHRLLFFKRTIEANLRAIS